MEVYVPHIRHVVAQFAQWTTEPHAISKELTSLLSPTIIYLTRQALFEGVEDLAKLAISSSKAANGPEHPETATALSNLSYLYASQHNFEAAEPYSKQALAIRKKVLGLSHENTIASLHDLAHIYCSLGMEKDATQLYLSAAKVNDSAAQKELANRYEHGIGVSKDPYFARLWRLQYEYRRTMRKHRCMILRRWQIDLTPLHHAVQLYEADHIRNRAADYKQYANVADKNGQTPLHWAVKNGKDEVARLLVAELGADANVTDRDGQTPLYIAVVNGRVEVAGSLQARRLSPSWISKVFQN